MATNIVETFPNADEGTEAFVTLAEDGYHVALKDLDSGEFVPTAMIFPFASFSDADALSRAKATAKRWANVK